MAPTPQRGQPREWTRAGEVGRAPSERVVCLGDEATTHGGGSAAAESQLARVAKDPSGDPGRHSIEPIEGAQQCGHAPQLIHPGVAGLPAATGPARGATSVVARAERARARSSAGFAPCAGSCPDTGGARESAARCGRRGRDGVAPRHNRQVSARGRPWSASPPRDRVRTRRSEQAEKLMKAVARQGGRNSTPVRTGWSDTGKPWRRLSKGRSARREGGQRQAATYCIGEATPTGTHPGGSVGGP